MEHDDAGPRWVGALCLITALAAALRLYGLSRYSIWYDESTTLYATQFVDWNFTFLRASEIRLIPLFPVLTFFWHGFVSSLPGVEMGSQLSDGLLRVLPLTFGVAIVPLTFFAGRHFTGNTAAGLIAALLVAVSPFHIYYAQELRPHSLYALLVLAGQYYSFRALEEDRPKLWVAAVAFSALSFYAYYFAVFFFLAINLYVLLLIRVYRPRLKRWIISQACLGFALVPALILALFTFETYTRSEEHWVPFPTLRTVGITLKNFFAGYSPEPLVYWPLFLLAGAACLAGIASLRSKPRIAVFLVLMSVGALLIQVVFWNLQSFSFYTYRVQLAYSPTLFILAGAGISWMKPRWVGWATAGLIMLLTAPTLADLYAQRLHVWPHRIGARYKVDSRSSAAYIKERVREGDFVAHATIVTLSPFRYHYLDTAQSYIGFTDEERQWKMRGVPDAQTWESIGFFPLRIEDVSDAAKRVWYVQSGWELDDFYPIVWEFRAWYDAHAVRIDKTVFDGVTVFLYDMSPALLDATRTDWVADFGTREIPRYDFSNTTLPEDARAAWRDSFAATFPPQPSPDPFGLDVWVDGLTWDGTRPLTPDAAGPSTVAIHLANRSDLDRRVSSAPTKRSRLSRRSPSSASPVRMCGGLSTCTTAKSVTKPGSARTSPAAVLPGRSIWGPADTTYSSRCISTPPLRTKPSAISAYTPSERTANAFPSAKPKDTWTATRPAGSGCTWAKLKATDRPWASNSSRRTWTICPMPR
ncbi:MAG: glycosyltransferase family 39 protein [Candidatus Hydrogenedentes bacterium]|nr:glycosyltransferase family 39 protein [Candidatus Hydrogenedentota bacterium]